MTLNDFLEAIAKKLIARWPVRHVFVNRIPAEADGNFYVRVIETTQEQKLDRRRVRTTRFEVCYLQADRDNLSFNTWLEANSVIERTFKLEEQAALIEERIKVANHRIEDLEKAQ